MIHCQSSDKERAGEPSSEREREREKEKEKERESEREREERKKEAFFIHLPSLTSQNHNYSFLSYPFIYENHSTWNIFFRQKYAHKQTHTNKHTQTNTDS